MKRNNLISLNFNSQMSSHRESVRIIAFMLAFPVAASPLSHNALSKHFTNNNRKQLNLDKPLSVCVSVGYIQGDNIFNNISMNANESLPPLIGQTLLW